MLQSLVVHGSQLRCNHGTTPSTLNVVPGHDTTGDALSASTVDDYIPLLNIQPFGMCMTQANPLVAAATAAAQGVLTPQPCIPSISHAWVPGSAIVTINRKRALTADSCCNCQWTGTIRITDPSGPISVE